VFTAQLSILDPINQCFKWPLPTARYTWTEVCVSIFDLQMD
jgi:hypothetical protein